MSSLLLVGNPRRRTAKSRKPRSAAQKAATRLLVAHNKARKNPVRRARRAVARHTPAKRRTRRAAVRSNPIRHRRARRNPIGGVGLRGITASLKAGAMGAAGAIGIDVLFGAVQGYLPASLSSPVDTTNGGANYGYYATKAAAAIGVGLLLKRFLKHNTGRIVEGSLTVTLHDLAKQFIATNASSVTLGRYIPNAGMAGINPGRVAMNHRLPNANTQNVVGLGRFIQNGAAARRGVAG